MSNVKAVIRSSCSEVFYKKSILRNFAKFTGKHLCLSLFFNKVADIMLSNHFAKFLRTPFFTEGHILKFVIISTKNKKPLIRRMFFF